MPEQTVESITLRDVQAQVVSDLLSRELTITASDENTLAMLTDADYEVGNHVLAHFGRFSSNRIVEVTGTTERVSAVRLTDEGLDDLCAAILRWKIQQAHVEDEHPF
jgi:hypothetical protein